MRIALVTGEFPPKWGGIGSHCYNLVNKLSELGCEIHVITRRIKGVVPPLNSNIHLHSLRYLPLPVLFTKSIGENALRYFLEELDVDILHLQYQMISIPGRFFKLVEEPVVSTFHGSWKGEGEALRYASIEELNINDLAVKYLSRFFQKYELIGMRNSDVRITVSRFSASELVSYSREFSIDDFHIIPNGVDTSLFTPQNKVGETSSVRILYVGRFAGRKGVYDLLEAFKILNSRYKGLELHLVGRGKLDVDMRNVFIHANLPFKDLVRMYASCDIFVLPSYYEAQGIVLLEAMSSGLPCVATNVGGVPETVVDGETGLLVEPRNPKALADSLGLLIVDETLRRKLGEAGRKRMIERYDWSIIARETKKIYESML